MVEVVQRMRRRREEALIACGRCYLTVLVPHCPLSRTTYSSRLAPACGSTLLSHCADYWALSNNVVPTLLIMLAGIVLEATLLYILNNRELLRNCCSPTEQFSEEYASGSEELQRLGIKEDDDVMRERERCMSAATATTVNSGSGNTDLLCVRRLAKQFVTGGGLGASSPSVSTFVAVRNSSFGVNRGDVLGLLGPNGAGKTTTIAMVTGATVRHGGVEKRKRSGGGSGGGGGGGSVAMDEKAMRSRRGGEWRRVKTYED